MSGKIDVSILTTGVSAAARKRRNEVVDALKKLIASKRKVPTLNYQKLFTELKETMQIVIKLFIFKICLFFNYLFIFYFNFLFVFVF